MNYDNALKCNLDSTFTVHNFTCTREPLKFNCRKCDQCIDLERTINKNKSRTHAIKKDKEIIQLEKKIESNTNKLVEERKLGKKIKRQLKNVKKKNIKLQAKLDAFEENGKTIDITCMSEANKWGSLCKLAYDFIDR